MAVLIRGGGPLLAGVVCDFEKATTLVALWAKLPQPHQVWAPANPSVRVRAQP